MQSRHHQHYSELDMPVVSDENVAEDRRVAASKHAGGVSFATGANTCNPDTTSSPRAAQAGDVPAWQQDAGYASPKSELAFQERNALIQSLNYIGRHGVIIDDSAKVLLGTVGWVTHVGSLATLNVNGRRLCCLARQSQLEFEIAIGTTLGNATLDDTPVALRDLDGWVQHYVILRRVGFHNPDSLLVFLPHSPQIVGRKIAELALQLSLTETEVGILQYFMEGQPDHQIAEKVGISIADLKKVTRDLVGKFSVRQKSDIIRLLSSAI
jgi:DNA-binding CsgD family transcriptional regulator